MKKLIALILVVLCVVPFAACNASDTSGNSYDLGNADRARVFYETYEKFVEKYGEGKVVDGKLCGTAAVRLFDFTNDGSLEMLIAYSSQKDSVVDSIMVCGFDLGFAELYREKINAKTTADSADGVVCIYTDGNINYIVSGEDLSESRSYATYKKTDNDGNKYYCFMEAFKGNGDDLSGTYEKIEIAGHTDAKEIFDANTKVLDALKSQKN